MFVIIKDWDLECFRHLPDAGKEVHLSDRHGDLQDAGGDPALVLAVHQPPELGLAIGQRLDHGPSGAILSPDIKNLKLFNKFFPDWFILFVKKLNHKNNQIEGKHLIWKQQR